MSDCIFCKIAKGEIPSVKVYEDEKVFVFEDINPISAGHTLIIPKHHAGNIWEISEDDLVAIHAVSKKVAAAIQKALKPDGIACLQLNGKGAHQVVMHYHLHLMPHFSGEPQLSVTDWDLKPGNMEVVKKNCEKIKAAL